MQYLNLSGTSQHQTNRQPNQNTYQHFKQKQQQNLLRLASIQKQLNTLCCQHDSLMPLLQLNNYQSVCYRWENSLKSINKKLGDYQAIVMSIGVEEVRAQQGQQREVENGKMITLNKIKENIEDIRAKMQDNSITSSPALSQFNPQSRLIQSLYQPLNNQQSQSFNSINPNPLTQFQQQSSQALQQLKKHINMSLAIFKNQLLLSQFSQPNQPHQFSPNTQPQKPSTQYQQQSIQKYTQNIFSELKKQIQYLRSNLGVQDIRDFHQKTMDRLSCDIAQLEDMFEIFFDQDQTGWEREAWVRELGVIEEKVMVIGWQIKGMRKKYFYEINRMYCVEKDGFQANVFEKIVEKDLQLLEKAFKQLKAKFLSIKSSTNQTTDNLGFNKSKLH